MYENDATQILLVHGTRTLFEKATAITSRTRHLSALLQPDGSDRPRSMTPGNGTSDEMVQTKRSVPSENLECVTIHFWHEVYKGAVGAVCEKTFFEKLDVRLVGSVSISNAGFW